MEGFYKFSPEERAQLTDEAIADRKTLMLRWKNLPASEAAPWRGRAGVAAALIANQPSVADMGCGAMGLEPCLTSGVRYVPVDVVARDARTIVSDFNLEGPRATNAGCAACLGLLEYLFDIESFLAALSKLYEVAVISYNVVDAASALSGRRSHAWVNDLSKAEIVSVIIKTGWRIENEILFEDREFVWLVVRQS